MRAAQALTAAARRHTLACAVPKGSTLVAVGGLAAYVVTISIRGATLSSAVFLMADAPAGTYLGAALLHGHIVTLPLHSELLPTLAAGALLSLPAGHVFVQLLGPLCAASTVGVMVATVRRLGASPVVTIVLGVCAGPIALWSVFFATAHVFTLFSVAVYAYAATRLISHPRRGSLIGWSALGAAALAGDQSFVVAGLLPLVVAVAAVCLPNRVRRPVLVVIAMLAATGVAALVISLVATLAGLRLDMHAGLRGSTGLSSSGAFLGVAIAARTFGWMLSGSWYGASLGPLDAALALLGSCVPLIAPVAVFQAWRSGADEQRKVYLAFWAAADVLVLLAFIGLGYAQSIASGRYLLPCALSAIATAPMLRFPRWRVTGTATLAAAAVAQTVGVLAVAPMMLSGPQAPSSAGALLSQIKHLGLTRGYADYWTSAPITWISEEHINVYPVIPGCGGDGSLCPYTYASPSWYVPQAQSTFLIVRTPELCPFGDIGRVFGKPQRSVEIDPGTHVLVYSYDIASRFTPKASICF